MTRVIRRDDVKAAFRPIGGMLSTLIDEAREATAYEVIAKANPDIVRTAHIHRLSGTKRWILVADGLVDRRQELPNGFEVLSSDEEHNAGKYVFRFPGGVFTVRQQPHNEDDGEGQYLQTRLDEVLEQAPLRDDLDPEADLKVFLSVPALGPSRLIVKHTTLDRPMEIALDEISAGAGSTSLPQPAPKRTDVRSTRVQREDAKAATDDAL